MKGQGPRMGFHLEKLRGGAACQDEDDWAVVGGRWQA